MVKEIIAFINELGNGRKDSKMMVLNLLSELMEYSGFDCQTIEKISGLNPQ
jgi:hypothetical protein